MKQIACVAVAVIMIIGLSGCSEKIVPTEISSQESASTSAAEYNSPEAFSDEAASKTEWVTPTLDLEQQLNEISYKVPSTWSRKEDASGFFYFPDNTDPDRSLYINYESPKDLQAVDIFDDEIYNQLLDGYVGGMETGGFEITSQTYVDIAGNTAVCVNYMQPTNGQAVAGILYAFITPSSVYTITICEPESISKGFEDALSAIIKTITIQ